MEREDLRVRRRKEGDLQDVDEGDKEEEGVDVEEGVEVVVAGEVVILLSI